MRAPKAYVVSVLITICTLLSTGNAQTSNPRTGPEVNNSQDSSPKPSNSTATSTLPPAASNTGQPAPGKTIGPMSPTQRATPAIPATDDLNPPLETAVPQSQAPIPQNVLFELFFNNMGALNQAADHDDKAGEHVWAARWRTHDQRAAGLNDAEGQILRETALDFLRALKEQDAKFNAAAAKFRAQLKPGAPIQIPPELVQMDEDRKKIVSDHIEKLREALGDASFNKLDTYIRSTFHAEMIVPKPVPQSTTEKK